MKNVLDTYNKFSSQLSAVYDNHTSFHRKAIVDFTAKTKKGAKVLDLGYGIGKSMAIFNELGYEAIGVDGSVGMIKEAKKRHPNEKYFISDIIGLDFPNDSFDAVWSWSVLTHLSDADKQIVLGGINKVLKKDGIFSQSVWQRRGLFINENIHPRPHYLLSIPSWKRLYVDSGFSEPEIKFSKGEIGNTMRLITKKMPR